MERKIINPHAWQDNFGFVQANEFSGFNKVLVTAGQVSVNENGELLHPNDMEKQIEKVLDNIEEVLEEAGCNLSDVVRFTYFTTSVQKFIQASPVVLIERLKNAGCMPATSLIGVNELFHPDCVVEIEATIAK